MIGNILLSLFFINYTIYSFQIFFFFFFLAQEKILERVIFLETIFSQTVLLDSDGKVGKLLGCTYIRASGALVIILKEHELKPTKVIESFSKSLGIFKQERT